MKTRQKIKQEEMRIRELLYENEPAAIRAWKRMMDYFTTNDYLEGNNHIKIISYIYLTRHYLDETFYCCAWKNFIGERTLYRYRKKYVSCFTRFYKEEKSAEKKLIELQTV